MKPEDLRDNLIRKVMGNAAYNWFQAPGVGYVTKLVMTALWCADIADRVWIEDEIQWQHRGKFVRRR